MLHPKGSLPESVAEHFRGGEGAVRDAVVFLLRRQGRFEALVEQVYGARV